MKCVKYTLAVHCGWGYVCMYCMCMTHSLCLCVYIYILWIRGSIAEMRVSAAPPHPHMK